MRCLICKRLISTNLTFSNFLKNQNDLICDACFKRYPLKISYAVIPIGKNVHIFSLYPKKYQINENAFLIEYSKIFEYMQKNFKNKLIIPFNNFNLTKNRVYILEQISKLINDEIFIICNYFTD